MAFTYWSCRTVVDVGGSTTAFRESIGLWRSALIQTSPKNSLGYDIGQHGRSSPRGLTQRNEETTCGTWRRVNEGPRGSAVVVRAEHSFGHAGVELNCDHSGSNRPAGRQRSSHYGYGQTRLSGARRRRHFLSRFRRRANGDQYSAPPHRISARSYESCERTAKRSHERKYGLLYIHELVYKNGRDGRRV